MRFPIAAALLFLTCCSSQSANNDTPHSVEELGVATPAHPVNHINRLEQVPGAPAQVPINSPAVGRATDAGASDETGPFEDKE